eukprot:Trichotokara_eunicae@DN6278_c6_g1_i13.p1
MRIAGTLLIVGSTFKSAWGDACYQNLVIGFPASGAERYTDISSAEDCHDLCQRSVPCVAFQYQISRETCFLKYVDEVENALSQVLTGDLGTIAPSDPRRDFCMMDLDRLCFSSYDCLACDDTKRCAYFNEDFVSGPKFCTDEFNVCAYDTWEGDATVPADYITATMPPLSNTLTIDEKACFTNLVIGYGDSVSPSHELIKKVESAVEC